MIESDEQQTKRCTRRDAVKPVEDFHRHQCFAEGRRSACAACRAPGKAARDLARRATWAGVVEQMMGGAKYVAARRAATDARPRSDSSSALRMRAVRATWAGVVEQMMGGAKYHASQRASVDTRKAANNRRLRDAA